MDINFSFLPSPLKDFLVKLLKKPFERRINEILIQSQNDYLKQKFHSDGWIQLNDFLEIFFELENIYSNDKRPCSKVHVKNISDKILDRVFLTLSTTYYGNKKVKQSIEIENMNPKDIYVEFLDKIPLQDIMLTEEKTFICSHGSL
ncbi:MAG: hypothetical protein MUD14_15650, partial [Hydrococcus sp. Prado102]|nr:hypothetical protein [Hydrococcus sp. Prado102]